MAQEIQLWQPSTTLSLEQRAAKSKETLALSTSPQAALKAAKQLVGCYPHARPPEPETYAGALAAVLAQYPLGIVTECADPRAGLARERDFPPTVAAVVAWCDRRLEWHQSVAAYVPRPALPEREFTNEECQRGKLAQIGLKKAMRLGDASKLTFEQAVELGRDPTKEPFTAATHAADT